MSDQSTDQDESAEPSEPAEPAESTEPTGSNEDSVDAEPEDREEIEAERGERLDPDNRPDDAEVDNTQRDFDAEKGMFTDAEGFEEAEVRFPPAEEQAT